MNEHLKNCPAAPRFCKHKVMGCQYQGSDRDVSQHESDTSYHFNVVLDFAKRLQRENEQLKATVQRTFAEKEVMREEVERQTQARRHLEGQIETLRNEIRKTETHNAQIISIQSQKIARLEQVQEKIVKLGADLSLLKIRQNQQDTQANEFQSIITQLDSTISLRGLISL